MDLWTEGCEKIRTPGGEQTVGFAKDAAEKVNLNKRTIQQDIAIVDGIPEKLRDELRDTDRADSREDLAALARAKKDPARFKAASTLGASIGRPAGSCKNEQRLRVEAEGVVPFDFSGEPPVAKVLAWAPSAPVPQLFHDGLGSRVTERSSLGVQADTRHHAHRAPG